MDRNSKGVYIYEDGKISAFDKNEALNNSTVYTIFKDAAGNIWFGTHQSGVVFYNVKTNSFKQFTTAEGLMKDFIFSINQDDDGAILIGTIAGLNKIDSKFNVTQATEIHNNQNISYSSILKMDDGSFYIGTYSEGMFSYNFKKQVTQNHYNLSNGLTNNAIMCLLKDREGNVWIGTNGVGVFKYYNNKFIYYTKQNGLLDNYINAVSEDLQGNIWVALSSNGVAKIEKNKTTSFKTDFKTKNSLPDNNVYAVLPVQSGKIYFGTESGLCYLENDIFTKITDDLLKNKYITSLFEDSKKRIWIGTTEGVFKIQNGILSAELKINALQKEGIPFQIFFITEDKQGRLLIGTENGLLQYDGENIITYNEKNKFISSRISCAAVDQKKNIWLGTSEGLYLYDYNTFSKIGRKEGFTSGFINLVQIDKKNNLYVGTNNGLDVLTIDGFYLNESTFKHFGKDDGLISLESNANASTITKNGRVLIGTVNGLEIYDPKIDIINKKEAILNITDVKLFFGQDNISKYSNGLDTMSLLPKNLSLPYSKNNLTFKFVGVSLIAPEKVMYKYKLEGLDNEWTPDVSKTEVTYPSLPPGSYTFMVKAMNNDGIWNTEAATFNFEISPPWYKTWWFYTICTISLIGSVFAFNDFKTKKLIADKQKLETQVSERTKELREEKEKVEVINKEVIEQKAQIENKNVEITDSIKYAKNIQEALLPSLTETENSLKDCFILYLPKDIVSGDFFWHSDHNNIQFIAAADCTGHGVPGAFMSIVGNNLLNEITNQRNIINPGEILLELHKGVKIALNQNNHESERRDGMDIALCAIHKDSNVIEYSGANRPLWIFRKDKGNELEIIKPNKFPIGGIEFEEKRTYINHRVQFTKGDTIYIFSDGFADQFGGPRGKKFMLSNMQKLLHENVNNPIELQRKNISEAFRSWKNSLEQIDDVLVIGIKL